MPKFNKVGVQSGNGGDNTLVGLDGSDILFGRSGDDVLIGGLGNDLLFGGFGDDSLYGGDGDDLLFGGHGDDTMDGGTGNDTLHGGHGDDSLLGGDGNDTLYGDHGNDLIDGGAGHDLIKGSDGDDTLTGGAGSDAIFGGQGYDTAVFAGGVDDYEIYLGDGGGPIEALVVDLSSTDVDYLNSVESLYFAADDYTAHLTGANNAVLARDDSAAAQADTATVIGGLTDNDFDFDGDVLTITGIDTTGLQGSATLNPDGTVSYDAAGAFDSLAEGQTATTSLSYTVTDGNGSTDTATVEITVTGVNDAPEITSDGGGDAAAITIDENTVDVTTVAATDIDAGAVLSYAITGGADAFLFEINSVTGALSFIDAPDFEAPADADGDNTYDVTVAASDGTLTDTQDIAVTVADVDEGPVLPASFGFVINGKSGGDGFGYSAAAAGDVNGDGIDDFIISADNAGPNGLRRAGEAYVIFGKDTGTDGAFDVAFDLNSLDGTNGFAIQGDTAFQSLGESVSAGDINGDGFSDLIVGSPFAFNDDGVRSGAGFVIYGKDTSVEGDYDAAISVAALDGTNGFALLGIDDADATGWSVSIVGDVNGDGVDDMLLGAINADPNGVDRTGESYLVFGTDSSVSGGFGASIDLGTLDGTNGVTINGAGGIRDLSGYFVSAAGDVNGDGIDDLLIGAELADGSAGTNTGASYVIFGKTTGFDPTIELSALDGTNGFEITGLLPGDLLGVVSAAGDINGDGIGDFIVGADGHDQTEIVNGVPITSTSAGEAYVIFGKDTSVDGNFDATFDLSTLDGTNGFSIPGKAVRDTDREMSSSLGEAVSVAGDVNGDGLSDILVGSPGVYAGGIDTAGEVYLIFGQDTATVGAFDAVFDIQSLDGTNGYVLTGFVDSEYLGQQLSAAGDINNDGFDDFIVGAPDGGADFEGKSYVIFGGAQNLALFDAADGVVDGSIDLSLIGENPLDFV